jgi:hypothetical protein
VGVLERLAVGVAEDFGGEQADHAGDAVAVEVQGLEVRIARAVEVHFHAVDDFQQLLLRQVEAPGSVAASGPASPDGWRARRTGRPEFAAPPVELGARHPHVGAFVDHVVDLAAEGVERRDRLAPLGGRNRKL